MTTRHPIEEYEEDAEVQEEHEEDELQQLELEENEIQEYLKNLPFEVILKQRQQAQQISNTQSKEKRTLRRYTEQEQEYPQQTQEPRDREAPVERSARIRVNRQVKVFDEKKRKVVDPRFQEYTGTYNPDAAKKAYRFMDDLQQHQKTVLKKTLSSKKLSQTQRDVLNHRYNEVTNSIQLNKSRELQQQVIRDQRHSLNQKFKQGKTPFFKTKRIQKEEISRRKLESMSGVQQQRFVRTKGKETVTRMANKKFQFQRR